MEITVAVRYTSAGRVSVTTHTGRDGMGIVRSYNVIRNVDGCVPSRELAHDVHRVVVQQVRYFLAQRELF